MTLSENVQRPQLCFENLCGFAQGRAESPAAPHHVQDQIYGGEEQGARRRGLRFFLQHGEAQASTPKPGGAAAAAAAPRHLHTTKAVSSTEREKLEFS